MAGKNAPQMAPASDGALEDPLAFLDDLLIDTDLFDDADLPTLMDSPSGADDFAGASSSTSSAALPLEPDPELPVLHPQQQQSPNYFFMTATANGNLGGAGYSPNQAMGNQQAAIRRYSKPKAEVASWSALLSPSLGLYTGALAGADTSFLMPLSRSYLDLEELFRGEPLMDYPNMWKI